MRTNLGTTTVLLLTLLAPAPVLAQELATSFDQLRVVIKSGDMLAITDGDGKVFRGRLVGLSAGTMDVVAADGTRRALGEQDVRTIRGLRSDSLSNGAKTGFAIGGGLGLLAGLALMQEFHNPTVVPVIAAFYGGLGAGIGVGIDALISSNDVIFSRPSGKATLRVAPVLGPQARGIRLTLAF